MSDTTPTAHDLPPLDDFDERFVEWLRFRSGLQVRLTGDDECRLFDAFRAVAAASEERDAIVRELGDSAECCSNVKTWKLRLRARALSAAPPTGRGIAMSREVLRRKIAEDPDDAECEAGLLHPEAPAAAEPAPPAASAELPEIVQTELRQLAEAAEQYAEAARKGRELHRAVSAAFVARDTAEHEAERLREQLRTVTERAERAEKLEQRHWRLFQDACADVTQLRTERERHLGSLRELVAAMNAYEMDVDEPAPPKHREMMQRASALLAPTNEVKS